MSDKKLINPIVIMGENEKQEEIKRIQREMAEDPAAPLSIHPEEKEYLLLYTGEYEGEEIKSYEFIKGRTNIYEFIKNMIECIDIHESLVLSESVKISDAISVYKFMKTFEEYFKDSFDIEDYNN